MICVFYNAERFLREAIDSVLAQDSDDYEFLLIDDGSRDGSTAIALEHAARHPERVRYLHHPRHENRGIGITRNLGLANARGEFIAFIDADDVWRPAKLREQVALLDACPEAAILCGTVNYWTSWDGGKDLLVPTGHVIDRVSHPPETLLEIYPLGHAGAPCPSDAMFRRHTIAAVGGSETAFTGEFQLYEDQTFYGKFFLAHPVYLSSRVWLDYRQHADSCVARFWSEDGKYAVARRHYLEWFRTYVAASEASGADRILRSIDRATWELDHPLRARVLRQLSRLAS